MSDGALRPGRPVLVYDGDCGFCTTSAMAAERRLGLSHVVPWQHLDLDALGLTADACERAVQWVGEDGRIASGERAVAAALRHAGGIWRPLGVMIDLPGVRQIAGLAYRLIARYRYRLPGGTPACRLPQG